MHIAHLKKFVNAFYIQSYWIVKGPFVAQLSWEISGRQPTPDASIKRL
jgi:hypothetical protein